MRFETQNVRGYPNMNNADTTHDVDLAASQAGVHAWQEMEHLNHQAALDALPAHYAHFAPQVTTVDGKTMQSGAAVSWDTRYYRAIPRPDHQAGAVHLLTKAIPGVCDERQVVSVVLEQLDTKRRMVVASVHMPPKNKLGMKGHKEYADGVARLKAYIDDWLAAGYAVIILGDFNRATILHVLGGKIRGHKLTYRTPATSIDQIITIDSAELAWQVTKTDTLGSRKSDHLGRRIQGWLKPIPAPEPGSKPVQPPTRKDAPTDVERLLAAARSQVGYHEGRSNGHWNNQEKFAPQVPGLEWAQGQAWCDVFVTWCFQKAGLRSLLPAITASCDVSGAAWKKAGRWSEYPAIGAQVLFGTPADLSHTGIVHDYDDRYVYTYEGNTNETGAREGDGVYAKRHLRTDPHVVGYGYPKFAQPIKSADPAWKGRR